MVPEQTGGNRNETELQMSNQLEVQKICSGDIELGDRIKI
jgi:hypothetical protein